jgi:uncharacterized membrane protein (DUF106 family)
MPELVEFREVIESYPVAVAVMGMGVALLAAIVTRWVDQSSLDTVQERLAAYQDEVRQLNETRAELLARLEERGDELRRAKAQLLRREGHTQTRVEPTRATTLR